MFGMHVVNGKHGIRKWSERLLGVGRLRGVVGRADHPQDEPDAVDDGGEPERAVGLWHHAYEADDLAAVEPDARRAANGASARP